MMEILLLGLLFLVLLAALAKLAGLFDSVVRTLTDPTRSEAGPGARYTSRGRVIRTVRRRSLLSWRRAWSRH